MNRRDFIINGSFAAAGTFVLPELIAPKDKKQVGIQLWSVREDMKKDPKDVLKKISKMGFNYVEGFGYADGKIFGLTVKDFKAALKNANLTIPSFHAMITSKDYDTATKSLSDNYKKQTDALATLGLKYNICPYMIDPDRTQPQLMAEIYNKAAEYSKSVGMKYAYHNHDFEFKVVGDALMYETLLKETDKNLVAFEMDLYWVTKAAMDPIQIMKDNPGRIQLVHVKDMSKSEKQETCEVGEGVINFQEIFDAKDIAGIKYFIVELENYVRTPMAGIEVACKNLRKLKF